LKITRAIVATNDNPLYYEFWPIVAKAWRNFNIEPTAALIGSLHLDYTQGTLFRIPEIPGISSGFVAQVTRFIIPCFFPEEVSVIGDIDMIPLSKAYFTENVAGYSDDEIVIFSSDAYKNTVRYPMCYIAAKGKYFQEIIGLQDTRLETIITFIKELHDLGLGWDTDELFFAQRLHQKPHLFARVVLLNRGGWRPFAKNRIDRDGWRYSLFGLATNRYIDAHCLRPLHNYSRQLKAVTEYVNFGSDGPQYFIYRLKKPFRAMLDGWQYFWQRLGGKNRFKIHSTIGLDAKKNKVIAFSLYGYADRYVALLKDVITSYQTIFTDWKCRVYVGKDAAAPILDTLNALGCEIMIMNATGVDSRFTLWRFLPMKDRSLAAVLFRDLDSVASQREKVMVEQWLASPQVFHIIRDHVTHGARIMAGMCGIKSFPLNFEKELNKILLKDQYGVDQKFLETIIYPQIKNEVLIHDRFPRFPDEDVIVIPADDKDGFVGEIATDPGLMEAGKTLNKLYSDKLIDLAKIEPTYTRTV
jgi:hypothetical protein